MKPTDQRTFCVTVNQAFLRNFLAQRQLAKLPGLTIHIVYTIYFK